MFFTLLQAETIALWKLDYDSSGSNLNARCLIDSANNLHPCGTITMAPAVNTWTPLPPNPDATEGLLENPINENAVSFIPKGYSPYTCLTNNGLAAKVSITNSFTAEGWINRQENPIDTGWHYLLGAHISGEGRWILSLRNGGTNWILYVNSQINDISFPVKNDPSSTNIWRHLALTYDHDAGSSQQGVWELFVDSQSCGALTNSSSVTSLTTSDSLFFLGGRPNNYNTGNAALDYWRISDRVLATNEFLNAGSAYPQGLIMLLQGSTPALTQTDTPLAGSGAKLTFTDSTFEVDTFTEGALLFLDRTYTVANSPDWLRGQPFLRCNIDGGYSVTVKESGILTAITADPDNPESVSYTQSALLESLGFIWVKAPTNFQLFGTYVGDISRTYQKEVTAGDTFDFPKWVVLAGFSSAEGPEPPFDTLEGVGERLYNGIVLSTNWPPQTVDTADWSPMSVPYLEEPPENIFIDIGRQLFVDDFLIETTTLQRVYGSPEKYAGNPVLTAETALELNGDNNDAAVPKSGGLWWDPHENIFKLWYEAGWINTICYATSTNGI